MNTKPTKQQLIDARKRAWSEFFSSGQRVTATVILHLNVLPKDEKKTVLYTMEHPEVEEE
jgi:hypothetical protein